MHAEDSIAAAIVQWCAELKVQVNDWGALAQQRSQRGCFTLAYMLRTATETSEAVARMRSSAEESLTE